MPTLADIQTSFAKCLRDGPAAFPDGLFAQDRQRALLATRAHANTVSHARISALVESFPRLIDQIGKDAFIALARRFCDTEAARASDLSNIGQGFATFLLSHGATAEQVITARIDWAWLASYRAADAPAVTPEQLARLKESELLAMRMTAHPAFRLVSLDDCRPAALNLSADSSAVAISRPEAEVLLHPIDRKTHQLAEKIQDSHQLRDLLAVAIEQEEEEQAMARLLRLIALGAIAHSDTLSITGNSPSTSPYGSDQKVQLSGATD